MTSHSDRQPIHPGALTDSVHDNPQLTARLEAINAIPWGTPYVNVHVVRRAMELPDNGIHVDPELASVQREFKRYVDIRPVEDEPQPFKSLFSTPGRIAPKHRYAVHHGDGSNSNARNTTLTICLLLLSLAVIAAVVTVAVYFGVNRQKKTEEHQHVAQASMRDHSGITLTVSVTITSIQVNDSQTKPASHSDRFRTMTDRLKEEIDRIMRSSDLAGIYDRSIISKFRPDSMMAEYDLCFLRNDASAGSTQEVNVHMVLWTLTDGFRRRQSSGLTDIVVDPDSLRLSVKSNHVSYRTASTNKTTTTNRATTQPTTATLPELSTSIPEVSDHEDMVPLFPFTANDPPLDLEHLASATVSPERPCTDWNVVYFLAKYDCDDIIKSMDSGNEMNLCGGLTKLVRCMASVLRDYKVQCSAEDLRKTILMHKDAIFSSEMRPDVQSCTDLESESSTSQHTDRVYSEDRGSTCENGAFLLSIVGRSCYFSNISRQDLNRCSLWEAALNCSHDVLVHMGFVCGFDQISEALIGNNSSTEISKADVKHCRRRLNKPITTANHPVNHLTKFPADVFANCSVYLSIQTESDWTEPHCKLYTYMARCLQQELRAKGRQFNIRDVGARLALTLQSVPKTNWRHVLQCLDFMNTYHHDDICTDEDVLELVTENYCGPNQTNEFPYLGPVDGLSRRFSQCSKFSSIVTCVSTFLSRSDISCHVTKIKSVLEGSSAILNTIGTDFNIGNCSGVKYVVDVSPSLPPAAICGSPRPNQWLLELQPCMSILEDHIKQTKSRSIFCRLYLESLRCTRNGLAKRGFGCDILNLHMHVMSIPHLNVMQCIDDISRDSAPHLCRDGEAVIQITGRMCNMVLAYADEETDLNYKCSYFRLFLTCVQTKLVGLGYECYLAQLEKAMRRQEAWFIDNYGLDPTYCPVGTNFYSDGHPRDNYKLRTDKEQFTWTYEVETQGDVRNYETHQRREKENTCSVNGF